jgi:hypothetical protein
MGDSVLAINNPSKEIKNINGKNARTTQIKSKFEKIKAPIYKLAIEIW